MKTHEAPRLDMRNAVYPWLARQLSLAVPQSFKEPAYQPEKPEDLLSGSCWQGAERSRHSRAA